MMIMNATTLNQPHRLHRVNLLRHPALASLLLCTLCLVNSGCLVAAAGAAAGAGAYAYYQGEVDETYPVEFGQAYQTTKKSLTDRGLPIRYEHHQGMTGTIESSIEDGSKVTITIEEKPRILATDGHQTEIGIRVGTFGDSKFSKEMHQSIRGALTMNSPATATPGGNRLPPVNTSPQPIQQAGAVVPGTSPPPPMKNDGWKPASTQGNVQPPP
jgi:Protein of unknown function (DUF3568)